MNEEQLIEYIKAEHAKNINHQIIYNKLIATGWSSEIVTKAFIAIFGLTQSISPLQLSNINYLLAESIKLFVSQWKVLLGVALIPNLYDVFLWGIIKIFFLHSSTTSPFYLSIIIIFVRYFLRIWSTSVIIYTIINRNSSLDFKQAITRSWQYILKFIWTSVLMTIPIIIGTVLLVIPGIVLTEILSFTPYIFFEENISGLSALKRSFFYIKGYLLSTMWRMLGLGIVAFLLVGFIGGPLRALMLSFITPFSIIYIYLIYQKIKEIKSQTIS